MDNIMNTKSNVNNKLLLICALAIMTSHTAMADGLSDLRAALSRLQGNSPISARLESTIIDNRGDGKDKVVKNGNVEVNLKDGEHGLQVTFSNHVLKSADEESNLRIKDEEADTPTLNAVDRLEATELRTYLSSSSSLLRRLDQAMFIDEQEVVYYGEVVRVLNFELPMKTIVSDKRTREYVDEFEGKFQVIIDDEGVPLETQLNFKGEGRAYIVLSMKAYGTGTTKFKVVDERLVTMHQELTTRFESTFGERETTETLQLVL